MNNDYTVKSMYCKSPRSNGESANTVCTGCRGKRDSLLQKVISFKKMICQSISPVFVPSWITDTRSFSVSYIRTHSIIHCYNVILNCGFNFLMPLNDLEAECKTKNKLIKILKPLIGSS